MEVVNTDAVERYVRNLFETKCSEALYFHNIIHTEEVVEAVLTIAKASNLNEQQINVLEISAWFHDSGFSETYDGHELISAKIASNYLTGKGFDADKINLVTECILSTQITATPITTLSRILCDADLFHVSTPNFFYRKLLLKKEWEYHFNKFYTELEWHELNLDFLQKHRFLSEYGRQKLQKGQELNIKKVENLKRICSLIEK